MIYIFYFRERKKGLGRVGKEIYLSSLTLKFSIIQHSRTRSSFILHTVVLLYPGMIYFIKI